MSVKPLEDYLGYWLRFVSGHLSHAFGVRLAERGVTVAEWVMLRELHGAEALAPSEIAARLGLSRGAISKLAERLVAKGLVRRGAAGPDRRYHSLMISEAGRALMPEISAIADEMDGEFFGHMSPAERALIEDAMREIVRRHGLKFTPLD